MLHRSLAQMLHRFYIYLIINILCNICASDLCNICVKLYMARKTNKTQKFEQSLKMRYTILLLFAEDSAAMSDIPIHPLQEIRPM